MVRPDGQLDGTTRWRLGQLDDKREHDGSLRQRLILRTLNQRSTPYEVHSEFSGTNERPLHWDRRYSGAGATSVSWYQPEPAVSLALIDLLGVAKGAPVIDIGGGASLLLDRLLARGYKDLTVLDVSSTALEMARRRLDDAVPVRWLADPLLARREVDDQRAEANRVVIAHRAPELAEHLD
jgi:2-polyprenyl-3-methyl-5-hydroxy-6-metoxy-1,4-benzoquinol methylase